jgi:hypothetical protein
MASAIESEGLALIGAYDGCEQRRQRLRMFYWLGRMRPKPMRVRFGFGEVVGCAGGHARGRRLRRGVRRTHWCHSRECHGRLPRSLGLSRSMAGLKKRLFLYGPAHRAQMLTKAQGGVFSRFAR